MSKALNLYNSKKKWLSRAKKVYQSCRTWYVPKNGIKDSVQFNCPLNKNPGMKTCESITEFLNNSKFAKLLKNCTVPYRNKMAQLEKKYQNRKVRHNKKDIEHGLQEYEDMD